MVTIRELTPKDAEQFRDLRRKAMESNEGGFADAMEDWDDKSLDAVRAMLQEELDSANEFILGAFEDGRLVGMIGFFRPSKPKLSRKGHIWGTYILPQWRGEGVGGQLLDGLINRAKRISTLEQIQLTCINLNKNTVLLYQSRGFRVYAREKSAVHIGNYFYDELYMRLDVRRE